MDKAPETIKREQAESKRLMDEYFAKGGKVTVCEPGARTENVPINAMFGKKKKQKEE
jgi:hypothetical protein